MNLLFLCLSTKQDHAIPSVQELLQLDLHGWMRRIHQATSSLSRLGVTRSMESQILSFFCKLLIISGGTKVHLVEIDHLDFLMPQEILMLITAMCGLSVSEPMPFGFVSPLDIHSGLTRSIVRFQAIEPQDIMMWTSKLRDILRINSENPLSMGLKLESTETHDFYTYL